MNTKYYLLFTNLYYFQYFSSEIGRALKVDFLKVVCTSYFTSKICQKLGFTRVVSQDYADHKVDGEVVFKTAEPHKALTIDVYKL